MIRLKHILEQTSPGRNNVIITAYNQIVNASAGWGTDTDAIVAAIGLLKTPTEFAQLLEQFKNKKTGYSSFNDMINEEYDRLNYSDVFKLAKKLQSIGVAATFKSGSNAFGQDYFLGNFQITYIKSDKEFKTPIIRINSECKDRWNRELPKAVAFWRNWLKDPITRKKVENNYPYDSAIFGFNLFSTTVEEAFDRYEKSLSNLKLMFYDNTMTFLGSQKVEPRAYAFVTKGNNYHIYVNCSQNDPDPYGSLIHEIQHIIYNIKPLNPGKKIKDAFVTNKTVKQTTQQIQGSLPTSAAFEAALIASSKLGIDADYLNQWTKAQNLAKSEDPGYVCRETEKMSNIMSIRKTLNIKPGGVITYDMLKPYIMRQKRNTDMDWILMCWAKNNFPDINIMLNKINQLAANQSKINKTPGSNLGPKLT